MSLSSIYEDGALRRLFLEVKTIAIFGLSHDPSKESYEVAEYLKKAGYRIIPVNPRPGMILGEAVYPSLAAIPTQVDLVDVFRRSDACPDVVRDAILLRPKAIWLQLGIVSKEAEQIAHEAGIPFVMDRCTKTEHRRLLGRTQIDPKAAI
jgi:predicted CoA-binding protein